jgi:hypothetical protein
MSILLQLQRCGVGREPKLAALVLSVILVGCSGEMGMLSGSSELETGLPVISTGTEATSSVTQTSTEGLKAQHYKIQGTLHVFNDDLVPELSELTISLYNDSVWRCTTTFKIEAVTTVEPVPDEHLLGWWGVSSLASADEYCAVPATSLFFGIGELPVSVEPQVVAQGIDTNELQGFFLGRTSKELWAIGAALPPDEGGIMGVLQDGKYELTTLYLVPW